MDAAFVTLKLTPAEFDMVRAAVVQMGLLAKDEADNPELDPKQRRERRVVAVQAEDLARKIGA